MTDNRSLPQINSLFLFAHQDDEVGVFQKILDELRLGRRVFCAYLTDGVSQGHSSLRRNKESIAVLTKLGVKYENIYFVGLSLSIPDASLPHHLEKAIKWLLGWLSDGKGVAAIYLPAWEGGHHDHDALHAIGVMVASETGFLDVVRQYSLYNAYKCIGPFFRVMLPLSENGKSEVSLIPTLNRIRFLRFCLSYPSQTSSWIGLFPFVLFHYIFFGAQALQTVDKNRLYFRPHSGKLYYEKRKFYTWENMRDIAPRCLEIINLSKKYNHNLN